jgi:alpha-maltose-1-phosphate synthase
MQILVLAEGDAETRDSWSGISLSVVRQLRALGHQVLTGDVEPKGLQRAALIGLCFAPDRRRWSVRYHLEQVPFRARSANAARHIRRNPGVDLILQFGATFEPQDRGEIPYVLYSDGNIEQAWRGREIGNNDATFLRRSEADAIHARERRIYAGAAAILTISDRLRTSFIEDFGVRHERVSTVFAGPNFDPALIPARQRHASSPPTVLFIGRQFMRKGGDLLLRSFALVRERVPDARLVIVGPTDLKVDQAGVDFRGFINKDLPAGQRELLELYAAADVFCMPSRFEGFAISFLEAMLFGLPCVSTWPSWTPPEMILDGETGYTVEPENEAALADRLALLLLDPELAIRMGERGRRRVQEHFTWPAVARRMDAVFESVLQQGGRSSLHSTPTA